MHYRALFIVLILLLFAAPCLAEIYMGTPPDTWEEQSVLRLTVFPTSCNDSVLLECGGKSMLIDGGYAQHYNTMHEALEKRGYGTYIDYIVNSHPHDDHIECEIKLVKNGLKCEAFLSPFAENYGNKLHKQMVKLLNDNGLGYKQLENGETFLFGEAQIDCFSWLEAVDVNARSLQMHVRFGDSTLLLTGDLTGLAEHHYLELLEEGDLKSDILKAPHHSLVHMVPEYLETVDPGFVIITNTRGDTPKTENQLNKRSIQHAYISDGTMVLTTDGRDWYITQEKGWH